MSALSSMPTESLTRSAGTPASAQLLVGELAVGVGGGMEHACAGVGHVGHYRYEFQAVHEFGGLLARPFEAE